jgi:hypothetical protein
MINRRILSFALAASGLFVLHTMALSQSLVPAPTQTVPAWIGNLTSANVNMAAQSNSTSTQEELPGLGHKFELLFAMNDDHDPQNPTNDVISVLTTTAYPAGIGVAFRDTPPGFKIAALTNQLQLKYYFPMRNCGGGSPRIQIAIDTDGDGVSNGNAFGYVGHGSFGEGCVTGSWDFVDMTDAVPARWDLTQFGLGYHNWQSAVTAISTVYPNHKVLSGSLVDDSCSFSPTSCGQAYYDLFTFENRTLEQDQDTVKNGH